jgi:hypothetical protein
MQSFRCRSNDSFGSQAVRFRASKCFPVCAQKQTAPAIGFLSKRRPSEIYTAISTRMSWSSSSLAIWRWSMLARSAPMTGSARL